MSGTVNESLQRHDWRVLAVCIIEASSGCALRPNQTGCAIVYASRLEGRPNPSPIYLIPISPFDYIQTMGCTIKMRDVTFSTTYCVTRIL